MFAEESMYGQAEVSVDNRGRIFMPQFTYAEPEDKLLIISEYNYLKIVKEDEINKLLDELNLAFEKEKNQEKKEILFNKRLEFLLTILKKCEVDTYKRILIGDNSVSSYKVIGAKTAVYLKAIKHR